MLIFVTAITVALVVSFLCSIFESVLLSLTRPQVELSTLRGRRPTMLVVRSPQEDLYSTWRNTAEVVSAVLAG